MSSFDVDISIPVIKNGALRDCVKIKAVNLSSALENEIIRILREYFPVKEKNQQKNTPTQNYVEPNSILSAGKLGVIERDGRAMVSSRSVAEIFTRRHANVIRDIHNLECSKEFAKLNFELCEYFDLNKRQRPEYYMTRDGFTFLVMGFTGKSAAKFKEAYINAFNAMENALKQKKESGLENLRLSQSGLEYIKNSDNSTPFTADMTAEELKHHDGE